MCFCVCLGGGVVNEGVVKIYEVELLLKLKKNDKYMIDVVVDCLKVCLDMK